MENGQQLDRPQPEKSGSAVPEGMRTIDPAQRRAAMQPALKKNLTREILAMMDACVHCGQCAQACHYYASTGDPELIPVNKMERLRQILRTYFSPVTSRLRPGSALRPIPDTELAPLFEAAFENCTICGKCALTCPVGINAGEVLYLARALLCSIGKLPSGLVKPVKTAFEVGNYVGLSTEDFIENIEWIAEEMADDLEEEDFSIPVDRKNAEVLYIPHPLEVRDLPFLLMDAVKILHAAGENYTFSSYHFDSVNYAFYQGSKANMMHLAERLLEAQRRLGARKVVMAPCGHGYRVMRWEVERYLGRRLPFPVLTLVEQIDTYLREGRIQLQKDFFEGPITFHDPCNLGRRGGLIEAPRNIVRALSSEFVEMNPHGAQNYCCGGGGGLASTGDYGKKRIEVGRTKAEQIRSTGAKVVATACFNCMTQIRDLNKTYDLGIEIKSIVELVAAALKPV